MKEQARREAFSDAELRAAAQKVRESLLSALPPPSICQHEFSQGFCEKMEALRSREKRRQARRKVLQRVAAIFLAFIVGSGIWLTVDADAREAFISWVREVYENHIIYHFFGSEISDTLPLYELNVLEGYEEVDSYQDSTSRTVVYQSADGGCYVFEYMFMQSGTVTTYDPHGAVPEFATVNGCPGEFIPADKEGEFSALLWQDDTTGISFSILSTFGQETLMELAESMRLGENDKSIY